VHWLESSDLEHGDVLGYSGHCTGKGASTMRRIYIMDVKGVCSLPRNDSAPCSQLNSLSALSSDVFIHLQEPTSPTHHTTLTLPTRKWTWITVKYLVNTFRFGYKHESVNDAAKCSLFVLRTIKLYKCTVRAECTAF